MNTRTDEHSSVISPKGHGGEVWLCCFAFDILSSQKWHVVGDFLGLCSRQEHRNPVDKYQS